MDKHKYKILTPNVGLTYPLCSYNGSPVTWREPYLAGEQPFLNYSEILMYMHVYSVHVGSGTRRAVPIPSHHLLPLYYNGDRILMLESDNFSIGEADYRDLIRSMESKISDIAEL